ncbi:MAG: DUF2384 domain-containing protein [Candidatus Thioglobus sp.]|uniref:antitoxin Xre/MbcA/ParS toxin-binding domain-containing protein n=1 Tax=Candidatus Thioglobus sp. TaxID=2026721 RepID=UPI001ECC8580|nr:antitoxin Xre/MbcA/ParS toxin-binding domain-containing protein [Candidatus Thioglobus sp.]MBT3187057.1 DUF2384 domain-containing protein [Candidatus Thioglobus sp.]MBT3431670.1 DUF2384 domain-containing protein [Candidatus Thioglobus sp.]MBT4553283.1 DUF2384 domain-containing protein [Candidatus Thioglobus sp.]MBT5783748.1 DUF2384 domain-containing protein [Candidatus Thioglobus sp.]MBT6327979.1 DUF2384 domain-containing protein [Candidatus Thioglobus sp.]
MDFNQLDDKVKMNITHQLTQILEQWQLNDQDQIKLLSLPKSFKARHLYLYRRGDKSFDFDEALLQRSKMILGIYESLGTTYPTNKEYAAIWLKRPVKKFKHKAPLELMLSGDTGMKRVWYFLDCTQSWQN